ncbi:hypothetical protein RIF29_15315 [Crotalaria pallida]|uniref:Uncharacterized protein n=1 Tax=Crotalaria pallida TaxID=3830 RepID=A0AAN9FEW6_CROPI
MFEPHIRFRDIKPEVDYVAFRARVIVLVRVPTIRRVHSSYNIHMVLMHPFGDEIHAAIYGPIVSFFTGKPPLQFKLVFLFSTLFERASSIYFPSWKLNTNSDLLMIFVHLRIPYLICKHASIWSWILKNVNKAGYYTVMFTIVGISNDTKWYYHECSCKVILVDISSQSSCAVCDVSVSRVVQRFKIPVVCYDSSATMTFYLLDRDARMLLKRSCSDVLSLPSNSSQIDNGNAIICKGKSAFVSYQRRFRRTHVKRNLNKDYDVMLIGESSNSSIVSHSRSNETVTGSNSKDSLATIPNPCDESIGVTHNGRKQFYTVL